MPEDPNNPKVNPNPIKVPVVESMPQTEPVQPSPTQTGMPEVTSVPSPSSVGPTTPALNSSSLPLAGQQPMSASQMGLSNQTTKKFNLKPIMKPLLGFVLLLVLAGGGWLVFKSFTGFSTKTVQADGVSYSVKYNRTASQVKIGDKTYLEGKDPVTGTATVLSVGKSVRSASDCIERSTIEVIATLEIEGEKHNVCVSKQANVYVMNFRHAGDWYFFTMFPKDKDLKGTIDKETVKTIAGSLQIH